MITFAKASPDDIRALSAKLQGCIEDKNSPVYEENVAKFGIPDEYVRKAFAEETLLKEEAAGNASFYLAHDSDELVGFAQVIRRDATTAELDRIVIFPKHAGKGIGTRLLRCALTDQRRKGIRTVVVNAGRDEEHARRFYEKNGFKQTGEATIEAPWGGRLNLVTYELPIKPKVKH